MSDQFIGVDVGGTKIAVAVLEGGELSERADRHRPTRRRRRRWSSSSPSAIEGSVTDETRGRSGSACRR